MCVFCHNLKLNYIVYEGKYVYSMISHPKYFRIVLFTGTTAKAKRRKRSENICFMHHSHKRYVCEAFFSRPCVAKNLEFDGAFSDPAQLFFYHNFEIYCKQQKKMRTEWNAKKLIHFPTLARRAWVRVRILNFQFHSHFLLFVQTFNV